LEKILISQVFKWQATSVAFFVWTDLWTHQ